MGNESLQAFDQALESIRAEPDRWEKISPDVRQRALKKFPFNVVYRNRRDTIWIIAVAHHSRRPSYWKKRTKDIGPSHEP